MDNKIEKIIEDIKAERNEEVTFIKMIDGYEILGNWDAVYSEYASRSERRGVNGQ